MEIPIALFIFYMMLSVGLVALGFLIRPKGPLFIMLAGVMIFPFVAMTDNVIMGYHTEAITTEDNIVYEVTTTTGLADICGGAGCQVIRGEWVADINSDLLGKVIDCIDITFRKSNAPTGTSIIGIFDHAQADSDPLLKQFGTLDATQVSGSNSQLFSFCLPMGETYMLTIDNVFGTKFTGGAVGTAIRNQQSSIDAFDGANSITVLQDATAFTWATVASSDFVARAYLRGSDTGFETVPQSFIFDQWVKIYFAIYGSILIFIGALVYQKEK